MALIEVQGFSKEKAFETTGLEVSFDKLVNATQAWKKAGSPINDKAVKTFFTNYMAKRKEGGAYIVVDSASDDTRLRPYTVLNETTVGKRKHTTTYQIKEADFDVKFLTEKVQKEDKEGNLVEVEVKTPYRTEEVTYEVENKETGEKETKTKEIEIPLVSNISTGVVVAKASKKDEALKLAKELTEANKVSYVIEVVKEVTEGNKYAAYVKYTPSKSAKAGKFLFFVAE